MLLLTLFSMIIFTPSMGIHFSLSLTQDKVNEIIASY